MTTSTSAPALADALTAVVQSYGPLRDQAQHHQWFVSELQAAGALQVGGALVLPCGTPATIFAQDNLMRSAAFQARRRAAEKAKPGPFAPAAEKLLPAEAARRRAARQKAGLDRLKAGNGEDI